MREQTVHVVHDTWGGRERRDRFKGGAIMMAIGIFLILASIGGILEGDYSTAGWLFIIGVALIVVGYMMMSSGRTPKNAVRISYE